MQGYFIIVHLPSLLGHKLHHSKALICLLSRAYLSFAMPSSYQLRRESGMFCQVIGPCCWRPSRPSLLPHLHVNSQARQPAHSYCTAQLAHIRVPESGSLLILLKHISPPANVRHHKQSPASFMETRTCGLCPAGSPDMPQYLPHSRDLMHISGAHIPVC